MNFRNLLFVAGLAVAAPLPVQAQPGDTHAEADEKFRQGREAFNRGGYKRALPLFRASHKLEPGRGKLLNIALCEEQVGELKSALDHFQEAYIQFPDGDDRLPLAREHIAQLVRRVPRIYVELPVDAPSETSVTLDDALVVASALKTDILVDVGKHTIKVTTPGFLERVYKLEIEEGKREVVLVGPGVRPSSAIQVSAPAPVNRVVPAPVKNDARSTSSRSRSPGIVGGAIAGAGIVTGLVFVGLRQGQISAAEALRSDIGAGDTSACRGASSNDERCGQLADANGLRNTFGTVSIVSFAVGGLAAAGALTYFFWPSAKPTQPSKAHVRLAPTADASHQGLMVWGTF